MRTARCAPPIKNSEEISVSKDDVIEAEGKVVEALPNATFKVQLSNGHTITAYISGKLRMNYIRIIEGDTVASRKKQTT